MVRLISRHRGGLAALKLTKLFGFNDFPAAKDSGKVLIIIIYCYLIIIIIVSTITAFAGLLYVHQPGANHAPRASVTQVNLSVQILSSFLRIRADPSMQIF